MENLKEIVLFSMAFISAITWLSLTFATKPFVGSCVQDKILPKILFTCITLMVTLGVIFVYAMW